MYGLYFVHRIVEDIGFLFGEEGSGRLLKNVGLRSSNGRAFC